MVPQRSPSYMPVAMMCVTINIMSAVLRFSSPNLAQPRRRIHVICRSCKLRLMFKIRCEAPTQKVFQCILVAGAGAVNRRSGCDPLTLCRAAGGVFELPAALSSRLCGSIAKQNITPIPEQNHQQSKLFMVYAENRLF